MRNDTPRLRLGVLGVVAVSLFAALFARLWYLQVLAAPEYQMQATALQQRVIIEPAPRGRILDRDGDVLVENRLSYVVSLDRDLLADLDDAARTELLGRLVGELQPVEPGITVELLEERLQSSQFSPYVPVPVVDDVPEDLAFRLIERQDDYDDVVKVETKAVRSYPYGRLASHILGYVGPINDAEYAAMQEERAGEYQLTDEIGKAGVERTLESVLRGTPGRRVIEVDARGRFVQELSHEPPVAGQDVVLTIDAQMQAVSEEALREELARSRERRVEAPNPPNTSPAGAFVLLDTQDGSVVAMASYPDFDPASLTDGIDVAEWNALNADGSYYPLNNRAIAGQYAPGSTFKIVTAYGALRSGLITPETTINDTGTYEIPNCRGDSCRKHNAGRRAYGRVDLRRSLSVSSDVYYYDIGARSWFARDQVGDPIQDAATAFGMGVPSGVELPGEASGRVMTPEEFAQRYEEHPDLFQRGVWQAGDSVNLAIGQGEMLVTPIQLANAYAAVANGGTVWRPSLVREIRRGGTDEVVRSYEPEALGQIEFQPGWREAVVDGLRGVTTGEGTAAGTFSGFPNWAVAGKTGTAQVSGKADTAVFAAFAPADAPRYAAAAFMEESGFGGVAAAPLVRRVLEPLASGVLPALERGGEFGYTVVLPDAADPFAEGDVTD